MKALTLFVVLLSGVFSLRGADFDVRHEAEFKKCVSADAKVTKVAGGMKFTEGPVWVPEGSGHLVFSDIPANQLKRWTPREGIVTYRANSANANGNTIDHRNKLITCEHTGRRVAIEDGGVLRTLAEKYDGKRFNSPNDAVVKSDGTVWFTDPDYGLGSRKREIDGNYVYRLHPENGHVSAVVKDFDKPNGLCFSSDEKKLYVADSGKPRHIRVFDVQPDGTVTSGKVFAQIDNGVPDGIRCDAQGRVWSSAGDGVHIFARDGSLIGKILLPESAANLCFGGKDGKTLFVTAQTSLYSVPVKVKGAGR